MQFCIILYITYNTYNCYSYNRRSVTYVAPHRREEKMKNDSLRLSRVDECCTTRKNLGDYPRPTPPSSDNSPVLDVPDDRAIIHRPLVVFTVLPVRGLVTRAECAMWSRDWRLCES